MNSNLTPVPRTDKNGRVVTRHMKTAGADTKSSTLPPVKLSASPAKKTFSERREEFAAAIYGKDDSGKPLSSSDSDALSFLDQHNPGLLETVNTLLSNGNEGGTASVRHLLHESVYLIRDQMAMSDDPNLIELCYKEGYNCDFNEVAVRAWAIGTVRAEYSDGNFGTLYDTDIQDGIAGYRFILYGDDTKDHPDHSIDTDYWRGMTAYYATNPDPETEEEIKEAVEFIEWAGKQEDISTVITTSISRGTVNVDNLNGVIEAQSTLAPSIRSGAL